MSTPLVALQKPTDISLDEIESELSQIWRTQDGGKATSAATRASTFSIIVYEPEEFQQLLGALGFYHGAIDGVHGPVTKDAVRAAQMQYDLRVTGRVGPQTLQRLRTAFAELPPEQQVIPNPDQRGFGISEGIIAQNPCRVISLCPTLGEDQGVTAQVSAYCPLQRRGENHLICCEYITLRGTKEALERVSDLVVSLLIPDLPKFVFWKATPNPEQAIFTALADRCNCLILDSCFFSDSEAEFLKIHELLATETYIADLNWHRLSPWQELTAEAFDPPERRISLPEIDRISIDYEKGNPAQGLMYLGWIASRLEWKPVSYQYIGGDYGIVHVKLEGPNQRAIEAELAAIPTADWGEIPGDLTGLRLTSTNEKADCCTILCSEATGCMRLEAGGSAQSCRTEQVSALSDQKAEFLLSQQLQRWGRESLYEESLAVATEILRLRHQG